MKFLLLLSFLFAGNLFSQEVLKKKGRKAIISNDGLDLDKGSVYYFSNGSRKVKVKVLKVTSSKILIGIIKGKISKGDELSLLSSSSRSRTSKSSSSRSGAHKSHRIFGGLSYLMGGELKVDDKTTKNTVASLDSLSLPALNLGYQFHMRSKLSIGLDVRYSLSSKLTTTNGFSIPGAQTAIPNSGANQATNGNDVTGSYFQIIPNVGYNIMENLRLSLGFALSSFKMTYPNTGTANEVTSVTLSGKGIHAGLEYDYFFNDKLGLKPKLSMEMLSYSSPQNVNKQDIFPNANIKNSIMSASVDLVYKF